MLLVLVGDFKHKIAYCGKLRPLVSNPRFTISMSHVQERKQLELKLIV
jgi:hypothetical protein